MLADIGLFLLADPVTRELQTPEDDLLITASAGEHVASFCPLLVRPASRASGFVTAKCVKRWVVELYVHRWAFSKVESEGSLVAVRAHARAEHLSFAHVVAGEDGVLTARVLAHAAKDVAWRDALLAVLTLALSTGSNAQQVATVRRATASWLAAYPPAVIDMFAANGAGVSEC